MSNSEFTKIFGRILILHSKINTPKEKSQNLAFEIFNIALEYPWYCFFYFYKQKSLCVAFTKHRTAILFNQNFILKDLGIIQEIMSVRKMRD